MEFSRCMLTMVVIMAFFIHPNTGFGTVTFQFYESEYSTFLSEVRNELAVASKVCEMQVTPSEPARDGKYIWVILKTDSKEVMLGINRTNGYVLGYQDKYNGKIRANVFNDVKDIDAKVLFPDAATTVTFPFSSGYTDLERPTISGTNRRLIELTFEGLHGDVEAVAGQASVQTKLTAKFCLRSTQFVSEAARFKFIQLGIENQSITPEFRSKMISYENKWDAISQQVHFAASATNCGTFESPITVDRHELKSVNDVKQDLSLIKYKQL